MADEPIKIPASPVMRRFALFIDGMARAMILPFGPTLVYRLVYGNADFDPATWSNVAYYLAGVVAVYTVGRWAGTIMAAQFNPKQRLPVTVARLGGAAIALHIFTYGAGLASVLGLVAIRFLSATLAGLLCGITRFILLPEDDCVHFGWNADDALRRREAYVDIASGTAKIYLTGFSVSILSGGLLFRKATKDSTFQALTGAYQFSLSPLFLVAVALTAEIALRALFALAPKPTKVKDRARHRDYQMQTNTPLLDRSPLPSSTLHSPIKEHDQEDEESAPDVLSGSNHTTPRLIDEEMTGTRTPFLIRTPPTITHTPAERELDVGDPLIFSARKYSYSNDTPARMRFESHGTFTSVDDYYDCQSVCSDVEMASRSFSPPPQFDETEVAQYVDGKCIYADGTPAYVPPGDCTGTIPPNYLAFYGDNKEKARKAWEVTQRWRLEKNVWNIHSLPNRWFAKIKEAYPHFVHGYSKAGYPIVYEQPGKMKLAQLFREGCAIDDMVHHYTFFMEFISNVICSRNDVRARKGTDLPPHNSSSWGIMVVMDVQGAGLSHLSGDVIKYLKRAGDINSAHFPMSMKRAFLINSPFWLAGAWSGIKGILPESVQVDILSTSKYPAALREYIDEDQIPPEYGGTCPYKLGEHPFEEELKQLIERANSQCEDDIGEGNSEFWPVPSIQTSAKPVLSGTAVSFSSDDMKTPPRSHAPRRRRMGSLDRQRWSTSTTMSNNGKNKSGGLFGSENDIFVIVSLIHVVWSAVQGAIEISLPLWILSPSYLGGLGYSPSRSGVSIFSASLFLLWILRSKRSRMVSQIPSVAPMRAFRIGAGSETILMLFLAIVTLSASPSKRSDSIVVMASSIIVLACVALASMLGRSASTILHRIAAEAFARNPKQQQISFLSKYYTAHRLITDCESGTFTMILNVIGEIAGIICVAPLWAWSMSINRRAPFDGTFILFVSSLITFALYVTSFALHLNKAGEFGPHPKDSCGDVGARKCMPFLGEIIAVSAGDMASLFEEANWTSTPLLGSPRHHSFSDNSKMNDLMERGEAELVGKAE